MTIDQQRVRDVARDHARVVNIQLIDILDDVNATTSRGVGRFNDPQIALRLLLF